LEQAPLYEGDAAFVEPTLVGFGQAETLVQQSWLWLL